MIANVSVGIRVSTGRTNKRMRLEGAFRLKSINNQSSLTLLILNDGRVDRFLPHAGHENGRHDHLDAHRSDDVFHVLRHDHHANRSHVCSGDGRNDHGGLCNDHAYAFYNVYHDAYHVGNACKHDGVYGAGNAYNRDDHDGAYSDAYYNGAFLACGDSSDGALHDEADHSDARNRDTQLQYSTDNHEIRYFQKSHHWPAHSTLSQSLTSLQ